MSDYRAMFEATFPRYYCACGCAQEVEQEGDFYSDECGVSPVQWQPGSDFSPVKETWEDYLDRCAGR